MKPLRHGDDIKSAFKKGSKGDSELQIMHPMHDMKHIPASEKFTEKEEPLQARKQPIHSKARIC